MEQRNLEFYVFSHGIISDGFNERFNNLEFRRRYSVGRDNLVFIVDSCGYVVRLFADGDVFSGTTRSIVHVASEGEFQAFMKRQINGNRGEPVAFVDQRFIYLFQSSLDKIGYRPLKRIELFL